ncbi:MAG: hypothetical protein AAF804_10385, partial [Bacteroidota bacterium]
LLLWMWLFGGDGSQANDQAQLDSDNPKTNGMVIHNEGPVVSDQGRHILRNRRSLRKHTIIIFEDTHFRRVRN